MNEIVVSSYEEYELHRMAGDDWTKITAVFQNQPKATFKYEVTFWDKKRKEYYYINGNSCDRISFEQSLRRRFMHVERFDNIKDEELY